MSSDRRRGLGRGLGALIPSAPAGGDRPTDVFFPRQDAPDTDPTTPPRRGGGGMAAPAEAADGSAAVDRIESASSGVAGEPQDDLAPVPGARFAEIPVDSIRPNPRQPRQVFDEDDLAELVASITELGVLQPVVVRPILSSDGTTDGGPSSTTSSAPRPRFELVMGERRYRASIEAGRDSIPAIVRDTDDEHMLRDALLENLHRAQLNPLEEAAAYQQLLEDFGCTHDELAGRIGRSRPQISNTIRLLKLPPLVQRRVASGVLSAGHARALLGLEDAAAMERLAQRIVAEGLSVRSVEEIVVLGGDGPVRRRSGRERRELPPALQQAAAQLSDRLDTRVQVTMGRHKGRITVEFSGQEDLDRILAALEAPEPH